MIMLEYYSYFSVINEIVAPHWSCHDEAVLKGPCHGNFTLSRALIEPAVRAAEYYIYYDGYYILSQFHIQLILTWFRARLFKTNDVVS